MKTTTLRATVPAILAAGLLLGTASGATAAERRLNWTGPAEGITHISLESSVGDVTVQGKEDTTSISVTVILKPRRSGLPLIGSTREGEKEIAAARLDAEKDGDELELELAGVDDKDRHFEERWEIVVPPSIALEIEAGVGDVSAKAITGGLDIDCGVGDVTLTNCGGEIEVEAGVGDVHISLPTDNAGAIDISSGVGDCEIHLPDHTIRGKGLGCDASWKGNGQTTVSAESGVGDVVITLNS